MKLRAKKFQNGLTVFLLFLNSEVDSDLIISDKSLDHIEYTGIGIGKWFAEGSLKLRSCTLFRK